MAMLVKWEDGKPVPVYCEPVTPQSVTAFMRQAASRQYEPMTDENDEVLPDEEQYVGMSRLQVGIEREAERVGRGDREALKDYLDRLVGKPKQQVETMQVTATLQDFLLLTKQQEAESPTTTSTNGVTLDGGIYVKVEDVEPIDDEWEALGI